MLGQNFASNAGQAFASRSLSTGVKERMAQKLGATHTARAPEVTANMRRTVAPGATPS